MQVTRECAVEAQQTPALVLLRSVGRRFADTGLGDFVKLRVDLGSSRLADL